MNALATLLLLTPLVLRSGARIDMDGPMRQEEGRVIFRTGGMLYSMAASEVDFEATRIAAANVTVVTPDVPGRLRVTPEERDRLLRELAKNHSGTAPTAEPLKAPPPPQEPANSEDEWTWRRTARAHEEAVRRAKEELQLLKDRADQLRQQIRGFVSLGYRPSQFTYQTSELQLTIDSIPRAQLDVERAQRALEVFREDARKMGILPGWLR